MVFEIPLWTAFVGITVLSLFFLYSPDYTLNYILGFDLVMWGICGLVYAGEFAYKKLRK
jgi:hypothetical protein